MTGKNIEDGADAYYKIYELHLEKIKDCRTLGISNHYRTWLCQHLHDPSLQNISENVKQELLTILHMKRH